MTGSYFKPHSWNATCMRCGYQRKADQIKLEWTGLRVCHECFEERHPQDYVRGRKDKQSPPWTSPEPDDYFLSTNEVQPEDL